MKPIFDKLLLFRLVESVKNRSSPSCQFLYINIPTFPSRKELHFVFDISLNNLSIKINTFHHIFMARVSPMNKLE